MSEKNDLNGSEGGKADDLETSASDELPPTESPADGEDDFGDDAAAVTSLLGPERWVQFGFIAIGFAAFFVADKFLTSLCETDFGRNLVGAPDPMIVTTSAGIIGLVSAFAAYRHPVARKLADEVVAELAEVTWPTRDETYVSTVVVVVTSVVAAVFTGTFDALWSALTNIVYAA
jgi:preprotein translocase SecE subunit